MSFELYSAIFMLLIGLSIALFGRTDKKAYAKTVIRLFLILPVIGVVMASGRGLARSELNSLN